MKGVNFGNKHSYDDWNLILTNKSLGLPTPKTSSVELEGADGSIDTSEVLAGEIKFNNRILEFEFTMDEDYDNYNEVITDIANCLHGRKLKIILDEDDDYYYMGRCSINEWSSDRRIGKVVIVCDCEPYKYSLRPLVATATINGETYVKIMGKRMTVNPTLTATGSISLILGNEEIALSVGDNDVLDLFITEGVNTLKFKGNGTVKVSYVGGEL